MPGVFLQNSRKDAPVVLCIGGADTCCEAIFLTVGRNIFNAGYSAATRAAAARLGFTVGTMPTCRWMGTGPEFRKIGRRVVYAADALDAWAGEAPKQLAA